jgi:hypothetical protein
VDEAPLPEDLLRLLPAPRVARPLLVDVDVVGERRSRGRLHGRGRHEPGVLADLPQVADEGGVAGHEAGPQARHVRSLRQGMDGEHAVVARAQHGGGGGGRARLVVGELRVALVAGDDRAALPRPVDDSPEMLRACRRAGGVPGLVHPDDEGAGSVGLADARQVEVPALVEGHRDRAQAGQAGAHLVRRVRDARVQHGVARGITEREHPGQGRHELLGADAGEHRLGRHGDAEAATDPRRRCLPVRGRADRGRVPGRGGRGLAERAPRHLGHRIDRCADRAVDDAAGNRVGHDAELAQAVVGVRRRDEPGLGHESQATRGRSAIRWLRCRHLRRSAPRTRESG